LPTIQTAGQAQQEEQPERTDRRERDRTADDSLSGNGQRSMLLNVRDVQTVNVVNVDDANRALLGGELNLPGLFPRLEALESSPAVFRVESGLDRLPAEPGVILIRGARQSGKSTWLEGALRGTIEEYGPGSGLSLHGDHLRDEDHLSEELVRLASAFRKGSAVRRLFVDEITAVPDWVRALKRELRRVLVVRLRARHRSYPGAFVEVKRGRATALDFAWFGKTFPRARLEVICSTPFETDRVRGRSLHDFLHGE
jgi:hypothetical protein